MTWSVYGILIVFALFIVVLILNPNLTCFGKRIRSPFYPFLRKKKRRQKLRAAEDYGFDLGVEGTPPLPERPDRKKPKIPTEDYGFNLSDEKEEESGKSEDDNSDRS